MKIKTFSCAYSSLVLLMLSQTGNVNAAIGLDRTRVVFDGSKDAASMTITNNNTQLPYLAQGWIENEQGEKVTGPMVVLPLYSAWNPVPAAR